MKLNYPTIDQVTFTCTPEEEDVPVQEALSFAETGADHSDYIAKVLEDNSGNPWLWCTVAVEARYKGLSATVYLGACAYKDEEDFKQGGYYEQMRSQAYTELRMEIRMLVNNALEFIPKKEKP